MIIIKLAGLRVRLENRYPFIEKQCKDYLCDGEEADFTVSVTPEEIKEEQQTGAFSAGYCESICLYRHISEKMPEFNVFLMHASVLEVDGYAYAFTAKSGVGKSTHTALWLKNVPHARVLNGDKPLLRLEEGGTIRVYGTPWNGKENWGVNSSAELAGICFIERGTVNRIEKASEDEVIGRLMHQLYLRGSMDSVNRQLVLMDALVRAVPYYILHCNISDEAAQLSWSTMRKKKD